MATFLKSSLIIILMALIAFRPLYASALGTAFAKEIEKFNREKEILIHLTLLDGKKIQLQYENHTDLYVEGHIVEFDAGNRVTQKENTKILFEKIESFSFEKRSPLQKIVIFGVLAAGLVLVGAIIIVIKLASHDWEQ